jgi:hypothetical protein
LEEAAAEGCILGLQILLALAAVVEVGLLRFLQMCKTVGTF